MKKVYTAIAMVMAFMLLAINSQAQDGRPVWILAHGCNWNYSIGQALDLGANGVEVDVNTHQSKIQSILSFGGFKSNAEGKHWSLGHDFYNPEEMCEDGDSRHVSLKWVLTGKVTKNFTCTLDDDERLCVLWLDCKNEEYLPELVKYVHDYTPNGTKYAIIYNIYEIPNKKKSETEYYDFCRLLNVIDFRDNEFLNWGWKSVDELKTLFYDMRNLPGGEYPLKGYFNPGYNHFYTNGYFKTSLPCVSRGSDKANDVRTARRSMGEFCARAGIWTADSAGEVKFWLETKYEDYPTDFDVVLTYFPGGYIPPLVVHPGALKDSIENLFNKEIGGWRNGKNGKMHMARRNESFGYKR